MTHVIYAITGFAMLFGAEASGDGFVCAAGNDNGMDGTDTTNRKNQGMDTGDGDNSLFVNGRKFMYDMTGSALTHVVGNDNGMDGTDTTNCKNQGMGTGDGDDMVVITGSGDDTFELVTGAGGNSPKGDSVDDLFVVGAAQIGNDTIGDFSAGDMLEIADRNADGKPDAVPSKQRGGGVVTKFGRMEKVRLVSFAFSIRGDSCTRIRSRIGKRRVGARSVNLINQNVKAITSLPMPCV